MKYSIGSNEMVAVVDEVVTSEVGQGRPMSFRYGCPKKTAQQSIGSASGATGEVIVLLTGRWYSVDIVSGSAASR